MDLTPSNPEALRSTLRALVEQEPSSQEEFQALEAECVALARHIAQTQGLGTYMPEIVWHWLSDADIRFKEPEYRSMQNQQLTLALQAWESESAA